MHAIHRLLSSSPVGFAVGADHPLAGPPSGLEPGPLLVGEQPGSGVQGSTGGVERVARAAAVAMQVLLDPAVAADQRVAG